MIFTTSIKYPNTFNYSSGKTDLDEYVVSINRCIALILTSAKGELLGDPNYGSNLYAMLFDQYSDTFETLVKQEIVECVNTFETRVSLTENNVTIKHNENTDKNSFTITISYTILRTNASYETSITLEEGSRNGK